MIDDNADQQRTDDALSLLYDWFKHLTSLSLLTIGGVLSLTQGADGPGVKKAMLVVVLVFVGITGLLSFSGASLIVNARADGSPLPTYLKRLRGIAATSLSVGVGAFTYVFVSTLK